MTTPWSRAALDRLYTPELLAHARHRWENTTERAASIAADLAIAPGSLRRLAQRLGWVRHDLRPRGISQAMRLAAEVDALAASTPAPAYASKYPPELLQRARDRFELTPESKASIARSLGMHHEELNRIARSRGWTKMMPPPRGVTAAIRLAADADALAAAPAPSPVAAPAAAGAQEGGPATLDQIEQAVRAELATVEALRTQLGAEPLMPQDAARTARTLASLTETLGKLQRLRAARAVNSTFQGSRDDDIPADIDEFRHALARRIELFLASRRRRAGDADGDGGSALVDAAR